MSGLTIFADPPEPREYEIGKEYEFLLPVKMHVFEEDLTTQAQTDAVATQEETSADTPPATLPNTGGVITPIMDDVSNITEGLLIKNFVGETLTLTINGQTYTVANNAERTILLPPGHYTYTASIPFVATSGEVDLLLGQGVEMSVAINVGHDLLSVYQN